MFNPCCKTLLREAQAHQMSEPEEAEPGLPIIKKITFHAGIRIDKERPVLDRDVAWFTGNPIHHGRRKHTIYVSFCTI
ncbi:MAG: hypothetical protein M3Y76_01465 [Chloroflexota bacterium]|nr:hypothetical protein [Chloroflexota bacterium]